MATILFVVDGRGLEAQATLLAATLARHNGDRYPIAAYVSEASQQAMSDATRRLFDRTGTRILPLPAPSRPWASPYPHGNKILPAPPPGTTTGACSRYRHDLAAPLDLAAEQRQGRVSLIPEGVPSWRTRSLDPRLCPFRRLRDEINSAAVSGV